MQTIQERILTKVKEELKNVDGVSEVELHGVFKLTSDDLEQKGKSPEILPGSVYGLFTKLTENEKI